MNKEKLKPLFTKIFFAINLVAGTYALYYLLTEEGEKSSWFYVWMFYANALAFVKFKWERKKPGQKEA